MDIKQFIEDRASQFGVRTAVVCGETRLSYVELDKATNRFGNFLAEKGVRKGDRVAILLPNTAEFGVCYLGTIKVGAVAVPLDPRYKLPELRTLFDHCQPSVIVAESDCLEPLIAALPTFPSVRCAVEIGSRLREPVIRFGDIMQQGSPAHVPGKMDPDDVAHIGYTSGPTSHPHGVILTHGTLVVESDISAAALRQTPEDALMLFALPMHHVFGLVAGLLATFASGGKLVILPGLSLGNLMELIEKEKGTIFMGVPYVFVLMLRLAEQEGIKNDISSIRIFVSGGSCVPDRIALRFKELYHRDLEQYYGMTEACSGVTCTVTTGKWKMGSAGRLLPGWEMKIADDAGRELPVGQPGEIMVRGPIMKGYYREPQETAGKITPDGWLHTGDLGKLDADGDLFITGLKKKMIIVKGQNIYPVDIEPVLKKHPQVADAAVIGIPDELRGEIVGAAIRPRKGASITEDEIRQVCRGYLINYKIPKRIIFVDEIPRTPKGEPRKEELLALFARYAVPASD